MAFLHINDGAEALRLVGLELICKKRQLGDRNGRIVSVFRGARVCPFAVKGDQESGGGSASISARKATGASPVCSAGSYKA